MSLQHLRSSTANKRPVPGSMSDGQIAINTNTGSPGLFFKDSNNTLVKVGPVHVGTTAPNASPASGGTAGNSVGEQWLDTTGGTYVFKVWDGSAWRSESGTFVDVNGDVMTGALGIIAGSAAAPAIQVGTGATSKPGLFSPGADQLALSTNGTGRLFIDSSGRVGIGAAPSQLSTIRGANFTGSSFNGQAIEDPNAERIRVGYKDGSLDTGLVPAQIVQVNASELAIASRDVSTSAIRFHTGTGVPERLRITSTGQLSHIGAGSVGSPAVSFSGSAASNSLVVDSNSRVGIGSSSPTGFVTAYRAGAADQFIHIENGTTANGVDYNVAKTLKLNLVHGGKNAGFDSGWELVSGCGSGIAANNGYLAINKMLGAISASVPVALFDSQGRLGIGTASPQGILDLTGTSRIVADVSGATPKFTGLNAAASAQVELALDGSALAFRTLGAEKARITSSGQLRLAGAGITFNGDTATANELDDYEEGTFTPTIVGTTSAGTGTYTNQIGRYTKIGNRVSFTIYLNWTAHTGTGNIRVSNLPFTSTSATGSFHAASIYADGIPFTGPWLQAYVGVNSTNIGMGQMTAAGVVSGIPMDSAGDITITGHYEV